MSGVQLEWWELEALAEPSQEVATFLGEKSERALLSFSPLGYVLYIAGMGLVLTLGALRSLLNRRYGLPLIGLFIALWAGLFVNFLTINPKVVHLAVFVGLFLLLVKIKRRSGLDALARGQAQT